MDLQAHVEAKTAFKKASYRKINPRNLLVEVMAEVPDGSEDEWRSEFWKRANLRPAYLQAVVDWWFDNNITATTKERPSEAGDGRKHERQVHVAAIAAVLESHIERKAKIVLLDMKMPNGKELRRCTGAECKSFGGWFSALGDRVGATRQVGAKMSETAIQDFYDAHGR